MSSASGGIPQPLNETSNQGWKDARSRFEARRFAHDLQTCTEAWSTAILTYWNTVVLPGFNDRATTGTRAAALGYVDTWLLHGDSKFTWGSEPKDNKGRPYEVVIGQLYAKAHAGEVFRRYATLSNYVLADMMVWQASDGDGTDSYDVWRRIAAEIAPNTYSKRFVGDMFSQEALYAAYVSALATANLLQLDAWSTITAVDVQAKTMPIAGLSSSAQRNLIEALDAPAMKSLAGWFSKHFGFTGDSAPPTCNAVQVFVTVWQRLVDQRPDVWVNDYTHATIAVGSFESADGQSSEAAPGNGAGVAGPTVSVRAGDDGAPSLTIGDTKLPGALWSVYEGWPALVWDTTAGSPYAGALEFSHVTDPTVDRGYLGARCSGHIKIPYALAPTGKWCGLQWSWPKGWTDGFAAIQLDADCELTDTPFPAGPKKKKNIWEQFGETGMEETSGLFVIAFLFGGLVGFLSMARKVISKRRQISDALTHPKAAYNYVKDKLLEADTSDPFGVNQAVENSEADVKEDFEPRLRDVEEEQQLEEERQQERQDEGQDDGGHERL